MFRDAVWMFKVMAPGDGRAQRETRTGAPGRTARVHEGLGPAL